jgi:hypothetical protein
MEKEKEYSAVILLLIGYSTEKTINRESPEPCRAYFNLIVFTMKFIAPLALILATSAFAAPGQVKARDAGAVERPERPEEPKIPGNECEKHKEKCKQCPGCSGVYAHVCKHLKNGRFLFWWGWKGKDCAFIQFGPDKGRLTCKSACFPRGK